MCLTRVEGQPYPFTPVHDVVDCSLEVTNDGHLVYSTCCDALVISEASDVDRSFAEVVQDTLCNEVPDKGGEYSTLSKLYINLI